MLIDFIHLMNIGTGTTDHQNKYTPYKWGNEILRRQIAWMKISVLVETAGDFR